MAKKNAQKSEVTQNKNVTQTKSTDTKNDGDGFQPTQFLVETKEELAKVAWPSRQQVISESAAVILMVTLVSTTIYFVDNLFRWLAGRIF